MKVTISTHNGSAAHREHNVRKKSVASKQIHIDPNGTYKIWRDEKFRDAYHRIFDDAVERYNAKQKRADRKITNYYNQIDQDEKKHVVYEMIIGVYGKKENGASICDMDTGYSIMREFYLGWKQRNPNLELIGAYYHADEDGDPHVHLDYIPVAHGYKNGMDTQNGLVKALGEMGFTKRGKETAQIQWEARENQTLELLCNKYGLQVDHPELDGAKHVHTETYKAQKELEDTRTELWETQKEIEKSADELREKQEELEKSSDELREKERQTKAQRMEIARLTLEKEDALTELREFDERKAQNNVFEEANAALQRMERAKEYPVQILKETPAKSGLMGRSEATVTISRSDYFDMQQNYLDHKNAVQMYQQVLESKQVMMKAATIRMMNTADLADVTAREIVVEAKEREEALKKELKEAKEEISGLKKVVQELKDKLANVFAVIRFFPQKWKEMLSKTDTVRDMEIAYNRKPYQYNKWTSDRMIIWKGDEWGERPFLQEYVKQCRVRDLEPDTGLKERLEELERSMEIGPFGMY